MAELLGRRVVSLLVAETLLDRRFQIFHTIYSDFKRWDGVV